MLKIAVSACFFHADPKRAIFKGKTLLYLVADVSEWLQRSGVFPILLPPAGGLKLSDMVNECDGLLLQGGSDVAPQNYGEQPIKPEFSGDPIRDQYEISLVQEFTVQHKPVLGLCRGLQLLNVAFGGSLYQNLPLQKPGPTVHRNWDHYDENFHDIEISGHLAQLYPGVKTARVNSVHYQAIKTLGRGLKPEALSPEDGVIEAIRLDGPDYVVGVQWHPEFQKDPKTLNPQPLLDEFLTRAQQRKDQ